MKTTIAGPMNIGEAARRAGVTPKMIRHYESLGLLPKVHRTDAGYRVYTDSEVHTLQFIKRSRDLGFSIAQIAELLKLWQDRRRPSASVRKLAAQHVEELERKIRELESMRSTLGNLINHCHGNDRPDCPILEDLEGKEPTLGRAVEKKARQRRGRAIDAV